MGFFCSRIFGVDPVEGASTMYASAVITALGASGSSFAIEVPDMMNRARAEQMIDFMIASPLVGIDCEVPASFVLATGLLRSVMRRDYVGTCTSAIGRT
jgi:hypothetical protein